MIDKVIKILNPVGEPSINILVSADCKVDKIFIKTIEREIGLKVDIFFIDSTGSKRANKFKRHLSYFKVAFATFLNRNKYKYIIFWQQFIGFYYNIISKICFYNRYHPFSMILPFIYKKRKGFFGKIYKFLINVFLNSKLLNIFVCHSSFERKKYIEEFGNKYKDKIVFIKYGIRMFCNNKIEESIIDSKNRYFFSGGTSNRDYRTLIKAFERLGEKLKIACFPTDVNGLKIPSNVELIYNVFGNNFWDYMRKAYAVIISLNDPNISSGQIVLLSAMRLAKAIIITESSGIKDYVDNNCAIFTECHSAEDIEKAVGELVNNKEKWRQLGVNARQKFEADLTLEKFGKRISDILKANIWKN